MKTRFLTFIFFCLALYLSGCTVGPEYCPPAENPPQSWKNDRVTSSEASYTDYWWEVFEDPLLDSLEQDALSNNYDLQIAYSRIQEARAVMNVAKADLYPPTFFKSLL